MDQQSFMLELSKLENPIDIVDLASREQPFAALAAARFQDCTYIRRNQDAIIYQAITSAARRIPGWGPMLLNMLTTTIKLSEPSIISLLQSTALFRPYAFQIINFSACTNHNTLFQAIIVCEDNIELVDQLRDYGGLDLNMFSRLTENKYGRYALLSLAKRGLLDDYLLENDFETWLGLLRNYVTNGGPEDYTLYQAVVRQYGLRPRIFAYIPSWERFAKEPKQEEILCQSY